MHTSYLVQVGEVEGATVAFDEREEASGWARRMHAKMDAARGFYVYGCEHKARTGETPMANDEPLLELEPVVARQ